MYNVRFAPSPTGKLHIGGARTALYNYLIAKKYGGNFFLRIEDTDTERSKQEFIDDILHSIKWLGLHYNDIVFQSKRKELYEKYIKILEEKGAIYRCYCSKEELEKKKLEAKKKGIPYKYDGKCRNIKQKLDKPFVYRFKLPETPIKIEIYDLIRGKITFSTDILDDFILTRQDGSFLFLFAGFVDDVEMKINLIIRGDDHLNNAVKQILLYKTLGIKEPNFIHLPLILGPDKKRLSKRHNAKSISAYKEEGIISDALINFIARIGWGYKNQEFFTREELIEKFSIEGIGKSPGIFNYQKLLWLNREHLKRKDINFILNELSSFLEKENILLNEEIKKRAKIFIYQLIDRIHTLKDIVSFGKYFFKKEIDIDYNLLSKYLKTEEKKSKIINIIKKIYKILEEIKEEEFLPNKIEEEFEKFLIRESIKLKDFAQPLRIILSGEKVTPELYTLIAGIGKEWCLYRIESFLERYKQ
jgi:glutamyl-tRNA synthetase